MSGKAVKVWLHVPETLAAVDDSLGTVHQDQSRAFLRSIEIMDAAGLRIPVTLDTSVKAVVPEVKMISYCGVLQQPSS